MKNKLIKNILVIGLVPMLTFSSTQIHVNAEESQMTDFDVKENLSEFENEESEDEQGDTSVSNEKSEESEDVEQPEEEESELNEQPLTLDENRMITKDITLVINEINSAPDDWVELMNTGTETIDLAGIEIRDNSDDHRFLIPEGTTIEAGEIIVIDAKTYGKVYDKKSDSFENGIFEEAIGIGSGDSIRIYDNNGMKLDEYSWTEHANLEGDASKASFGRYPDGTGDFTLMPETKNAKNSMFKPQIVINEIESNGDTNDWVEIYNAGKTEVDISGWYILDNEPEKHKTDVVPLQNNTIISPGEYFVFEENQHFNFGLGKQDCATLYNQNDEIMNSYEWSSHAEGVYARIPDGTGNFVDCQASTKGCENQKEQEPVESPAKVEIISWPGSTEVCIYDEEPMFLEDSSGLDFHNGQLYAIDNGTGKFWILDVAENGKITFAKGFENGKRIIFPKDKGDSKAKGPDTEGITVDNDGYVYAASERDNSEKGVNYNTILRVNPNTDETDLVAEKVWDLTASLPQVSANMGIEAVEWVSNACVNGKLFDRNTHQEFHSSNYPNAMANGIFFVALEDNGHVYAYVLNEDESAVLIADIDSKIGGAMGLDYDVYENVLWIAADNGYENTVAKVKFNGTQEPEIVHVKAPSGLDTSLNNEGFSIADVSYTVNGQRPVYRFQDGVKKGALSVGYLNCSYHETSAPEKPKPQEPEHKNESVQTNNNASNTSTSSENTTNSHTVNSFAQAPLVKINDSSIELTPATGNKTVKLALLQKYQNEKKNVLIHTGKGVGFIIAPEMLSKIDSDLELSMASTELNDFANGFKTYQLQPAREKVYGGEIITNYTIGKEYAGKISYIFQKNLNTKAFELLKIMPVSEIGNIAFTSTQISDVIVMVQ